VNLPARGPASQSLTAGRRFGIGRSKKVNYSKLSLDYKLKLNDVFNPLANGYLFRVDSFIKKESNRLG